MCAVFGILGEFDANAARNALARMHHRGPDACGIVEEPGRFFAHNRLSIIDPSGHAAQPMRRGRVLLSFNGEIYNFKALRDALTFDYRSESDTEVLLAAYAKWGVRFVDRLVGMFAIALLDGDDLYLFRDRLGKKPLFYLHQGARFVFASEIKAITPFLASVRMNDDAMMSYLSFLAPVAPLTFYEGVYKLAPGSYAHYDGKQVKTHCYYSLLETRPSQLMHRPDALRKIDTDLREAIELRLHADVPMASLLSGGVDSALLAAIGREYGRELETFTLGYTEYGNYDERANAALTAEAIGLRNTPVEITMDDFAGAIDPVMEALDEPLNDPAAVPLFLLFEAIKSRGYTVVLSGEGSDELFLGYRQYFEYLDIEKAAMLTHKNWLRKYFHSHFSMNREWEWYKRIFDDTLLFRTSGEKFTDLQKNALMRRNVRDDESLRFLQPHRDAFERSAHDDHAIWYSYIDLMHFQAEHFLVKLDRVSMAHSIEARTPYLDHRLAETVFSLAPQLRYEQGVTKALLKSAGARYLPETVLARRKKGFSNPYMEWLISSGRIGLIQEVNAQTGLFKDDVLQRYIDTAHKGRFKQHVWGLYVLSHWIKKNLL